MTRISESALVGPEFSHGANLVVGPGARIGRGVGLGNNVVIHAETVLGDGVRVGDGAVLGKEPQLSPKSTASRQPLSPLEVGAGSRIGALAILYRGTRVGDDCTIGDRATVRENSSLAEAVLLGLGAVVENGTTIGAHTRIQTGAYVTAYVTIEESVFIAPMVTMTNDNFMGRTKARLKRMKGPHICRGARVGGGAVLLPSVRVGEEAFVAAGALVTKDVPPGKLVMGAPARVVRDVAEEELLRAEPSGPDRGAPES